MEIIASQWELAPWSFTIYTSGDVVVSISFGQAFLQRDVQHLCARTKGTVTLQQSSPGLAAQAAFQQLVEYLQGARRAFTFPYQAYGTAFEQAIWRQLEQVSYGQTISYGELAKRAGTAGVRAVGSAVGRNPLPIVIPCHRIVQADGRLGNYSGGEGPATKRRLLALEGCNIPE